MPRAPLYGLVRYSLLMFLFLYIAIKKMNLVLKDGYPRSATEGSSSAEAQLSPFILRGQGVSD